MIAAFALLGVVAFALAIAFAVGTLVDDQTGSDTAASLAFLVTLIASMGAGFIAVL